MKMLSTATALLPAQYHQVIHNCLRNAQCEPAFYAPLPSVSNLQFFVDFGDYKPLSYEIHMVDICDNPGSTQQLFPSTYVIGRTPEDTWYGVFKNFTVPATAVSGFVAWLSVQVETPAGTVEKTFFSEAFTVELCKPLTKIKSCHPEGATTTGWDVNGIYYGLPEGLDYLGTPSVRYFHIAYVRLGKVRELSNKGTFTSSLTKTFRSVLEKIFLLQMEMVPQWYKDVLLAVYMRGAVSVNDGSAMVVNELAFEALLEDDFLWKPFVQLKQTFRLYYGCDESRCSECCTPSGLVVNVFGGVGPEPHGIIDNDGTLLTDNDGTYIVYP